MKPLFPSSDPSPDSSAHQKSRRLPSSTGVETPSVSAPPETEMQILARRAQALAQPPARAEDKTTRIRVLTFTLDQQTLAIESTTVLEVIPLGDIAPLPGLPAFVRGLVNLRSRVVPAFDPRPLINLPAATAKQQQAILISHSGCEFFLLVDAVDGLTEIPRDSLSSEVVAFNSAYVRGVDAKGVLVLDMTALHRDLVIEDTVALPSF